MEKVKGEQQEILTTEEILQEEEEILKSFDKYNGSAMKMLFGFFKPHWKKLLISILLFILKASPLWIVPLVFSAVIDVVIERPDNAVTLFIVYGAIALVSILQNVPTHMLYVKYFSRAKRDVEAGLRGAMVRKLQQLSIGFHKEMASGKIQSKIMRDVEAVETMATQLFETVMNVTTKVVISIGIVLFTNFWVFLLFIVCIPVAILIRQIFVKKMRKNSADFRKSVENASSAVMDMIELVPVSRAHALENLEVRKITEKVADVAKTGYRFDYTQNLFGVAQWLVFFFFRIVCLFSTSIMAFNGLLSIGSITLYQTYFSDIVAQVSSVMGLMPIFSKGTEALNSIGEILNAYDIEDNRGKAKIKKLRGEYEFRNVRFDYDEQTPVLTGLNLHINAGEKVAFVGESGSGKTTIMNLIIGFYKTSSGKLLIDGHDIEELDLHAYRKHISVVPQSSVLFSGTIRDNITYGSNNISEEKLREVIRMARLEKVIEKLPDGLETSVGEHGSKLSGGQRQRIAIARAIIRDPSVIIFDEATSALDSETEKEIQCAIDSLSRGRTTFIVAHRLSTIKNADKIAVMRDGVCVEFGSYDELMDKKGEFYNLKQLQS